jgi:hypothetical protein
MTSDQRMGFHGGDKPRAGTTAIVALVCGVLLCFGPFTGIPAIAAGVLAHKAANEQPQTVGGRGMGTAGIVLGTVNLMLSLIVGVLAIWQFVSPEPP